MRLAGQKVTKPWGKTVLPPPFASSHDEPVGEIWFAAPDSVETDLLVKYLFTSQKLSVQVHPRDRHARRQGLTRGKDECWLVIDAEEDARIGLGLTGEIRKAKLRAAAATGAIEGLIDWKPVRAGDFFYVPAGTIHAIGGGISLIEVQQNSDVTYRLYDYGRPRELHWDEAIAVADLEPYNMVNHDYIPPDRPALLMDGPKFRLFQVAGQDSDLLNECEAGEWHVIPLEGMVKMGRDKIAPGELGLYDSIDGIDFGANRRCLIAVSME